MATTTNYGWTTPDDTALVKDGASAIRTLGSSVDTTVKALNPGTTSGDLDYYTAATTKARIAKGTAGQVFTMNSGATAPEWATPSTGAESLGYAAGKNKIINGDFGVWQRGTSVSISASSNKYTADRWLCDANANQALTVSRQATGDTTNLPFIQYCLRVQRNSGQTGTGNISPGTPFETANTIPYAGKTVTFSFYARKGADYSAASSALGFYIYTGTGTDQNPYSGFTGGATVMSSTATLTATWQRFTASVTLATSVTQISPFFTFTPTGTAGTNDYFEVTGVQLEVGSTATSFQTATGTIQGELAACQRYYLRPQLTGAYAFYATGAARSTTVADFCYTLPVSMRVVPTAVDYSNAAIVANGVGATALTNLTIDSPSCTANTVALQATVASGLTQFRFYYLGNNNNSAGYVGLSAEL